MDESQPFMYTSPPAFPYLPTLASFLNPLNSDTTESSSSSIPSFSSGVRTIRCRVCLGCQSPPCGVCCYCKDSLQFGGPGVKKQTCVDRKCVVLLENRIQKESKGIKVRPGCNQCVGCKQPDCQQCLVCYDKKFLNGKYLTGAVCNKKKCFGVINCELSLQDLRKLQKKQRRMKPSERTLKLKVKENRESKPKRVYKRRAPKQSCQSAVSSSPALIFDETSAEIVTLDDDSEQQDHENLQNVSRLRSPVMDPPSNLSPTSTTTQCSEVSEIQQYNPPQSIIPPSEFQMNCQNPYSSAAKPNTQFQPIQIQKSLDHTITPNSFMNYPESSFHRLSPYFSNQQYSNRPMRIYCRRYRFVRHPNNFNSNSSNAFAGKFDPFIPPSYSGYGDVILQAL